MRAVDLNAVGGTQVAQRLASRERDVHVQFVEQLDEGEIAISK